MTEVSFQIASAAKPVILVPTWINEQGPYEFALDTGASLTVVSEDLARSLQVQAEEARQGIGAGGKVAVSMGRVESLAVGRRNGRILRSPSRT